MSESRSDSMKASPKSHSNFDNVIMIGFDEKTAKFLLDRDPTTKVVVFDEDEENLIREVEFPKLFKVYKERITLYEGCVQSNIKAFIQNRKDEEVTPFVEIVV